MKTKTISALVLALSFALPAFAGSQLDSYQQVSSVKSGDFCNHASQVDRNADTVARSQGTYGGPKTTTRETVN